MKDKFKEYLAQRLSANSVNSYMSGINHLSKHHGSDIFLITDVEEARIVRSKYDLNGQHRDIGDYGKGTARNAIVKYCNFLAESSTDIPFKNDNTLPEEPTYSSFSYERDLHRTLESQVPDLYPDYILIGSEYSIEGVRIDLLLEKKDELLVVELKSGLADFQVFGQVSMYIGFLQQKYPEKHITGHIIASEIHPRLLAASKTNPNIKCKTYSMRLEINEA